MKTKETDVKSYIAGLSASAALILICQVAHSEDTGVYAGAKVGGYSFEEDDVEISDIAWGVYGGYMFNRHIGVEAEYLKLEEGNDSFPIPGTNEKGEIEGEVDIWALSIKPTLPLSDQWELYAKLGWNWYETEASGSVQGLGTLVSESDSDDGFLWGIGAEWSYDIYHLRAEFQSDDDFPDTSIYTVGVGINF